MIGILGNGLLGKALQQETKWKSISRNVGFDITDLNTFRLLFNKEKKYSTLINCIAITDTYSNDKKSLFNVNYKGVVDLVKFCNEHSIKLIHISTAYVYSNCIHEAKEEEEITYVDNYYTESKLLADLHIKQYCNDYIILRVLHKEFPRYEYGWVDQLGNYMLPDELALEIKKIAQKNYTGMLNIGGDLKTAYDWGRQYKKLKPGLRPEKVPADISMNLSKFKSLC